MKKLSIVLLFFFFCGPLFGMGKGVELNTGASVPTLADAEQGTAQEAAQKSTLVVTQANGQTIIDFKEVVRQVLIEQELERKKEKSKRCFGMYPWLKNHITVTTTIQVVGSFASMAGVVLVYYH